MLAGFVLSVVVGVYVVLTGMYHYGFFNVNASTSGWLGSQLRYVGERIYGLVTNPTKFDLNGTIGIAVGAVMAILLGTLRLRLWWWPLHPIGYLAANCWGTHWYWMRLIVGDGVSSGLWVTTTSIVRAYRKAGRYGSGGSPPDS